MQLRKATEQEITAARQRLGINGATETAGAIAPAASAYTPPVAEKPALTGVRPLPGGRNITPGLSVGAAMGLDTVTHATPEKKPGQIVTVFNENAQKVAETPQTTGSFLDNLGRYLGNSPDATLPTGLTNANRETQKTAEIAAGELASGAVGSLRNIGNEISYVLQDANKYSKAYAEAGDALFKTDYEKALEKNVGKDAAPLETTFNFGHKLEADIEAAAKELPNGGADLTTMRGVMNAVGGMAPSIVGNFIVPGSSLYTMAVGAAGGATEEALKAGAGNEAALTYGMAVGAIEAATEKIADGLGGVMGKGWSDKWIEQAVKKVCKNESAAKAINYFVGTLGEGFEEWIAEYAEAYANKLIVGLDKRTLSEISGDAGYSFVLGSLISMVMQNVNPASLDAKAAGEAAAEETVANNTTEAASQVNPRLNELSGIVNETSSADISIPQVEQNSNRVNESSPDDTKGGVTVQDGVTATPEELSDISIPEAAQNSNTQNRALQGGENAATSTGGKPLPRPAAEEYNGKSLKDVPPPATYEELTAKKPVQIVDISQSEAGTAGQLRKGAMRTAAEQEVYSKPHPNDDTGSYMFITPKTFTHSFSNWGIDNITAARKLPEIIKNAVLTHSEPSRKAGDNTTGVYTLFGAVNTKDGVRPIKLTVKEYINVGQNLPQGIKGFFERFGKRENFASIYDSKILEIENIEALDAAEGAGQPFGSNQISLTSNATTSIAEQRAPVNIEALDAADGAERPFGQNPSLIAGFAMLAAKGILKVADDKDKDKSALDSASGQSGTQINLSAAVRYTNGKSEKWQYGDTLMSVGFLEPINALMTTGVLVAEEAKDGKTTAGEYLTSSAAGTVQSLLDLPCMSSISELINAYRYSDAEQTGGKLAEAGIDFAAGQVSSLVPNIVRAAAKGTDTVVRDAYTSDDLKQQTLDKVLNSIPGLRETLPAKLDNFGHEKTYEDSGGRNFLNATFYPGAINTYKGGPLTDELERLSDKSGKYAVYPDRNPPDTLSYKNDEFELSYPERFTYQKIAGQNTERMMYSLLADEGYKELDDERKYEVMSMAAAYGEELAKEKALSWKGIDYEPDTGHIDAIKAVLDDEIIGLDDYFSAKDFKSSVSADKDAKGNSISGSAKKKALEFIDRHFDTPEQKDYVYFLFDYAESTLRNAPWH